VLFSRSWEFEFMHAEREERAGWSVNSRKIETNPEIFLVPGG